MILTSLFAAIAMVPTTMSDDSLKCAVMLSPTKATSKAAEYAGARFPFCCGGCDSTFAKDPGKYLADAGKSGNTIGMFMFCPVSGERLDLEKVKETVDYKGMRYGFCCGDCKGMFEKDPAKYTKTPEKEVLACIVSGEKIASYSASAGFMDYEGVRYYVCCSECLPALKKDPAKFVAASKFTPSAPKAMAATNSKPPKHDGN
ncbi:MAG: YHS domain-containing protein [Armatimonadetes bacterium]|nr:YHS domain-containing protein [Armatimonadota bacterium]